MLKIMQCFAATAAQSKKLLLLQAKNTKMEELTPGQAATLARNEQVIEAATDELEELEEQLNNSIAQSLKSKEAPEAASPSR